ncbi:hypothetical protein ACFQYP_42680 [Nonomuraea antimicrobica]|uniref:hypothetical protein n=1 Tax=Nonomuraea antimicrobica TaxID=561173 RepID=UPI0031E6E330
MPKTLPITAKAVRMSALNDAANVTSLAVLSSPHQDRLRLPAHSRRFQVAIWYSLMSPSALRGMPVGYSHP